MRACFELYGPEDGPAVVRLHHGLGLVCAWKAQIPAFAETGYRVLVCDGRGSSPGPRPARSRGVAGFDDDEKAGLVGHSDGGTMALCLAAHRPERVGALIAAAAHIYVEQSMLPGVVAVGKAFTHDAESREKLVRAHGAKVDRVFRSCPEGRAQLRHLDWDLRPVLQFVACPVFVVQGEEDECATPQRALDLAAGLRRGRVVGPRRRAYGSPGSPQEFNRRALEFLEDEKRVER